MNTWGWIFLLVLLGFLAMHFLGRWPGMRDGRHMLQQPGKEIAQERASGGRPYQRKGRRTHHK